MKETTSVVLSGVGGQGILLAGEVLATAAMNSGFDVKKSEVHGMAQRGGSVVAHVRFGEKVYSPMAKLGEVDYLLAFERLEALRYLPMLKPGGTVVMNDQRIVPLSVTFGAGTYPEKVEQMLAERAKAVEVIPALEIARELGNANVVNLVMLGALSTFLPFSAEVWDKSLEEGVPKKFLELNKKAFARGVDAVKAKAGTQEVR
jgi:indolepyruvate ferredoxin oxidoreductase beta subunit